MTQPTYLEIERIVRARKQDGSLSEATPLSHYNDTKAWVLLGDPGSGKSTTFEALAKLYGHTPITARDFIELEPPLGGYPAPLFIDGLDEYTVGSGDGFTAIGRIRNRLQTLGTPLFRISCREADWRGSTDSDALQKLVGADQFVELHLAPLDAEQILKFAAVWLNSSEAEAQVFVNEAHRKDLDGLLTNPQTLRMLIDAVGSTPGAWPHSKAETYATACAKLVREQNEAHNAAQRDTSLTDSQLLQAAGYLSVVMLLSGSVAIALQRQIQTHPHLVELVTLKTDCTETTSLDACRAALHTHLFAGDGTGNFFPVHRTVAEYLGAQFLAERIRAHLPANRVLALIQGEDGGVVPELRGLHAWLAVVADSGVRRTLIDHDPLGLVLHGDVLNFRTEEKIYLIQALQQEANRYAHFRSQNWTSQPFGALATLDMAAHFKSWLESPDRSPAHQAVVNCVLDAMKYGKPMPDLAKDLERVVRDKTYHSDLRSSALQALCTCAECTNNWAAPLGILEALYKEEIENDNNELIGILLPKLYPKNIQAKDLWKYYKPEFSLSFNRNYFFWRDFSTRYAPQEDLPALMDGLLATGIQLQSNSNDQNLSELIGDLLHQTIMHFGENTPVKKLYAWLGIGMGPYIHNCLPKNVQAELATWLMSRAYLYRNLVEHGITTLEKSDKPSSTWLLEIYNLMCKAPQPTVVADWYWELAATRTDTFRQNVLVEAFWLAQHHDGIDVALERLHQWTQQHQEDAEWVHSKLLSCPYPPDTEQTEWIDGGLRRKREQTQKTTEERAFMSEELPNLTSSQANRGLLEYVGRAYLTFDHPANSSTANERLLKKLHDNPHWVQMAFAGLRYCLRARDDLPSVPAILALHRKNSRYNIATPLLAAMQLRYDEEPSNALDLDDTLLQTLVAFRLTNNYGNTPAWFAELIEKKPELVAELMRQLMAQQIAAKAENIDGLYALAHDQKYAQVTTLVAPTLINALPAKIGSKQLSIVRELIACMLRTLDQPQQLALVAKQLAKLRMDVAQHVYWLTAAVQIAPETYLAQLQQYLGNNQTRAAHAYALLHEQRQEDGGVAHLTLEAKAFFIELLGRQFTPVQEPEGAGMHEVTPTMESIRFVQQLISAVAIDPSEAAYKTLGKLTQAQQLQPWISQLQHAIYEQQLLRRKALFKPASITEVCNTLANLQPANAADLQALVLDHLRLLAHEIRHSSTDNYDQYWDGSTPKVENACRNVLLSHLQPRLHPLGVSAEQEGTYADQTRADIKISYGSLHFPIEIKRDSHKDLWKAIREQLVAKYSRELASDGYGIYIVFWFGTGNMPAAADGGNKPKNSQELQQRLTATVPQDLGRKIAVLVIDCSRLNANK